MAGAVSGETRVDWVDYAKGFCIIMVVMMHSTLGVEAAAGREGFLHGWVAFAKPFRMPDFFLISGLFLARVIDRDWRAYLDRKVVHFFYFYVVWVTIQFAFKAPLFAADRGVAGVVLLYLESFIEPFGTLWFIYLLPIFFVVTKIARTWGVPPLAIGFFGAALEIAPVATGWTVIDEFAGRFIYFYIGYACAPAIFALAERARRRVAIAVLGLAGWSFVNGLLVFSGAAELPVVSLTAGLMGAVAVVALSALLAEGEIGRFLRTCGERSLYIYLGFFLPMAVTRVAMLKSGVVTDVGVISLVVTIAGVLGALLLHALLRDRRWTGFLYRRPGWLTLGRRNMRFQPAE